MTNWELILLNAYYIGVAIAFLVKDIFWLRLIMIVAGICMILHGFLSDNKVVIAWLSLFTIINVAQVIRILIENKDIKLGEDIINIYKNIFSCMTQKEFRRLWNQGEIKSASNGEILCQDSQKMDNMIFLIKGKCFVKKKDKQIAELSTGHFIAEMGFLTGKPASADVIAAENVSYIVWSYKKLNRIKEINPDLYNKFHLILSKDLTNKLKRYL